MREVIERNAYEIAKLTAAGCFCLSFLLLVASGNKGADAADWAMSAVRMAGFAISASAVAMFIDGRRQSRDARNAAAWEATMEKLRANP